MRQPRSAKTNPFPYRGSLVCYLSLDAAGSLTQVGHDFSSAAEAYRRAAAGEIRLYAVWPGEYSSDLFEIDDLNAFADAFWRGAAGPPCPRSGVDAQPDG